MRSRKATSRALALLFVLGSLAGCGGEDPSGPGGSCVADAGRNHYQVCADTVFDPQSGLTWERALGTTPRPWDDAKQYCTDLVLAGHNDWRLPLKSELMSLVDTTVATDPQIDTYAFPDTPASDDFWGNELSPGSSSAWGVRFSAYPTTDYADMPTKVHALYVKCVR